ncbi:MAG: WYL domain-containing protein [Lachnospiraceae bacterium]|nr:WYL domain-containing protein [Ruminococcus sp.]MCM1275377.1 WYL domain-containing protein [Lachnospiraceae bacterium]
MDNLKNEKAARILGIYDKLINDCAVSKAEEAQTYKVNERSIQRDIDDIRSFLDDKAVENGVSDSVVYNKGDKRYHLKRGHKISLTDGQVLAVCKVLLSSRAFPKEEMKIILNTIIDCCVVNSERKSFKNLTGNEMFHYVELKNKTELAETLWDIGQAILACRYIDIDYLRTKDKKVVKRRVKPLAIMFSEYYFYLTAFIDDESVKKNFAVPDDPFPTIYRIDRIRKLNVLNEKFHIPYKDRFEEGEFRKRVQLMRGGKLCKIKFEYYGPDVDAVLDKLPTAKVISEIDCVYTIYAEVYGDGIDMWLRSQGDFVGNVQYF